MNKKVYEFGNVRIMCGDYSYKEDMAKLFGVDFVDATLTFGWTEFRDDMSAKRIEWTGSGFKFEDVNESPLRCQSIANIWLFRIKDGPCLHIVADEGSFCCKEKCPPDGENITCPLSTCDIKVKYDRKRDIAIVKMQKPDWFENGRRNVTISTYMITPDEKMAKALIEKYGGGKK